MENTTQINKESSDTELMARFESLRAQACGEAIGSDDQTPSEAVEAEGWTVIRKIYGVTNVPGTPILAESQDGSLYVVNDLDGPWAVQVYDGFMGE